MPGGKGQESGWGLSPAKYAAPNMHEKRFSLKFLMEVVDALTALSFYFRPIRFVSANARFSRSTRFFDLDDHATSNVAPCDRSRLYFIHTISLLIQS